MANTDPLATVTIEAQVKSAVESGIVTKILVSIVASVAGVLVAYSDSIQAILYAVLPASALWIVPLILQGISWLAQLLAAKERVDKPDIVGLYGRTPTKK